MIDQLLSYLNWLPNYATGIWLVLTGILVFTLLQINKQLSIQHPLFKLGVVVIVLIWLYPLYTQLFYPIEVGFIGSLITLAATWIYYKKITQTLAGLSKWLYPVLVWAIISGVYTLLVLISKYFA